MTQQNAGVSSRTSKRVATVVIVIAAAAIIGLAVKYGRYHIIAKRFATVEAGKLYRSGELERGPLERVVEDHEIRTILTLLQPQPGDRLQQVEREVCEARKIELIRIGMPGDGCARFELLEKAADIIADDSKRPLLVHCAAGVQRTGAVYAVWRMKHCGWDVERAIREAAEHGATQEESAELWDHLRDYAQTALTGAGQGGE